MTTETPDDGTIRISLPNNWAPRGYQLKLWRYMMKGGKRAVAVWHRRAGKDSEVLNMTAVLSQERVGVYWHMLPEASQARKAVWLGIDKLGRRIIDQVFPPEIRSRTIDNEMMIELKNGSIWQVVGSDNYNSLVGANPVGVVFSEYSVGNPAAWDYLRPILLENGGWAVFIYTPRGKNHGKKLFDMAMKAMKAALPGALPDWFCELLSINETMVLTPEQIEQERSDGMDDDMIDQEFFCSWEGVRQGSIFGAAIKLLREQGRIGKFPYDRRYPVNVFWDIGHGDATSLWFHQLVGGRDRFIDFFEDAGQDVPYYVNHLKSLPYMYGPSYLPHDSKNVTLASKSNPLGSNVWDQLGDLGVKDRELVPRTPDVWTAINLTRTRLSTAEFDEEKCSKGINALESYHKKWDDERKTYLLTPVHDWSSNAADAIRQWATGYTGQSGGVRAFTAPAKVGGAGNRLPPKMNNVGSRRAGY